MDERWSIERIEDLDYFRTIKPAWQAALAEVPGVPLALDHDWLCAWWQAFGRHQKVFVTLVRSEDRLRAAAVWTIEQRVVRGVKVRVVRLLGNDIASRGNILLPTAADDAKAALRRMLANLPLERGLFVEVGRVPLRSNVGMALSGLASGDDVSRVISFRTWTLPIVDTSGSWDQYVAARSANFRKSVKRVWKATNDLQPTRWSGDADEVGFSRFFSVILSVSKNTWKFRERTAIAADDGAKQFFQSLLCEFGKRGAVRCVLMSQGDTPAAFIFGVVHRRCLYALKAGYAEDFGVQSPGHRTLGELVKWCFEDPEIDRIDLDCVSERGDYKLRWATGLESLEAYRLFPRRPLPVLAGRVYEAWHALRPEPAESH